MKHYTLKAPKHVALEVAINLLTNGITFVYENRGVHPSYVEISVPIEHRRTVNWLFHKETTKSTSVSWASIKASIKPSTTHTIFE